jgi:hypothetical protein
MKKTLYVLACALCTLLVLPAAAQVPSYVSTDGLVGWWPFNGNANDESGNGNDGVVNGATLTEDRFGNVDKAYSFDGSNNISVSSFPVNTQSISLTGFYKNTNYNSPGERIIEHNLGGSGSFSIAVLGTNHPGGTVFEACFALNNGSCETSTFVSPLNQTIHFAAIYSEGTTKIYINSIEIFSNTNLPPLQSSANGIYIGGHSMWGFQGVLDDIGIWNRALTEQEIQNLYTGTTPPPCVSLPSNLQQGLVGYWPFCGNANDESGNGNDGVVNGATLTEDRFGTCNSAYEFDGMNDFIEVLNSSDFSLANFSVSIWIQNNSLETDPPTFILNKGCIPDGVSSSTEMSFRIYSYSDGQYISDIWCPNRSFLAGPGFDSNWFHLSMVYDGITMSLYVDGILVESIPQAGPLSTNEYSMLIGARNFLNCALDSYYNGRLDDIGIWNRALTPEEVQELYTLDACTFTVYDTLTVYETVYDTVYTYETIYDTVTTYVTVTDTLLIDITFTGFEGQPSWLNTVTVFPNPASDHITIDYGNFALMAGYNTIITDAAGASVYSSAVNSQQVEIDINAWGATGVYYMSVYDASGVLVAVRHIVLE